MVLGVRAQERDGGAAGRRAVGAVRARIRGVGRRGGERTHGGGAEARASAAGDGGGRTRGRRRRRGRSRTRFWGWRGEARAGRTTDP